MGCLDTGQLVMICSTEDVESFNLIMSNCFCYYLYGTLLPIHAMAW